MRINLRHFLISLALIVFFLPVMSQAQVHYSRGASDNNQITVQTFPDDEINTEVDSGVFDYITPKSFGAKLSFIGNFLLLAFALFLYFFSRYYSKILERKVEERTAELKESKGRYQKLFENATDLIQSVNKDGKFLTVNKTWKNTLGYEDEEIENMTFKKIIAEKDLEKCMKIFQDVKKGVVVKDVRTTFVRKDGTELQVEGNINANFVDDKFVSTLGIFRDITDRVKREEKEREFEMLKSRFITALSHVTRTPLNVIRWNLEMILSGDFGETGDSQKTLLRHALENEGLILRLIQNMNMIMDIETGAQMIHKSPTAIASLVSSVGKSFSEQIKLKNIKFKSILPKKKIPALEVDAEKMRLVLDIIFDNAVRYTHEGGAITSKVSSTKSGIKISVTDTGIGIPEAEQDNIFDRFFRASNAHSMHTDGVGLGLYLAKYVIEAHGGKIGFKSAEGKGSTFTFEIPV